MDYVEHMDKFFTITATLSAHTAEHVNCNMCRRSMGMLVLLSGKEVDSLVKHILQHFNSVKLQKKIIVEDLKFKPII